MEKTLKDSSSAFIHIQVTVDTDALLAAHPVLSQDSNNPTMVNESVIYAVVSTNAAISGQGSSLLKFSAITDDKVRVYGTSEYANFDNPVLIYNIAKLSGDTILTGFQSHKSPKVAIEPCDPDPAQPTKVLPVVFKKMDFWYFESSVSSTGEEKFTFYFALYKRIRTQENPQLVGYFKWDPTIHVDR